MFQGWSERTRTMPAQANATRKKGLSDAELGKKVRSFFGAPMAEIIANNPHVAFGAVNGAMTALAVDPKIKGTASISGEVVSKLIAARAGQLRSLHGLKAFPHLPDHLKGKTHSTGDALFDDELPAGEELDLSEFLITGSFEDIWPGVDLLTTQAAAKKLGIVVSTLHEWCKTGKLLRLSRKSKRGYRVPSELILGKKKIVPGLAQIIARIGRGSHNTAWDFLTDTVEFEDGFARPLDLLIQGRLDEVLAQERRWGEMGGS